MSEYESAWCLEMAYASVLRRERDEAQAKMEQLYTERDAVRESLGKFYVGAFDDQGVDVLVGRYDMTLAKAKRLQTEAEQLRSERDEARNLTRWLWAACRELLDRYDRVERRGDRWMHKALNAERGARNAALEEAARKCASIAMNMRFVAPAYGCDAWMWNERASGAQECAQRIRALMSSDDEAND